MMGISEMYKKSHVQVKAGTPYSAKEGALQQFRFFVFLQNDITLSKFCHLQLARVVCASALASMML